MKKNNSIVLILFIAIFVVVLIAMYMCYRMSENNIVWVGITIGVWVVGPVVIAAYYSLKKTE
jgi:hypothetical protein